MASKEKNVLKNQSKENKAITNNRTQIFTDKSTFISTFSIITITTVIYLIVAKLIVGFYHPNVTDAIVFAKKNMYDGLFQPEPVEKALFFSGIFTAIIAFFSFGFLYNSIKQKWNESFINKAFWVLYPLFFIIIIALCYYSFISHNPFSENIQNSQDFMKTNWDFYFTTTFLHKNLLAFTFILFPLILFLFYRSNVKGENIFLNKVSSYSTFIFCGLTILTVFFITSFSFPNTYENKYDFNAVYYSVVQVYHGMPMFVNNFTNTYGLYPHFIMPFLKIFGLSILSFTVIMSVLLAFCFIFLLYSFNEVITNKWLILFGFTSVFFNSYMYPRIVTSFDAGYSTSPIRWILLFSLLGCAVLYLKYTNKILYYLSFFFFASGILWNPEIGVVAFLCLIAFYCFLDLQKKDFKKVVVSWIMNVVWAISILLVTFLLFELTIKLFYGAFPDLSKLFSTINVFSFIGLNMLPMPNTFHPYMLVVLIFLVGLLISINNILTNTITKKSAFMFLVTSLGILFFTYYLGRSHNWNLLTTFPMAFILLTMFADDLLKKSASNILFFPLFGIVLFTISFSLFQTIYDYKRITSLVYETDNKKLNQEDNALIKTNAEFIKENTSKNEKIEILSSVYTQSLYHSLSNTASAFNPGFGELFFKSDYNNLITVLEKGNSKIFFDPTAFRCNDLRIFPVLSSLYKIKTFNNRFFCFEKRIDDKSLKPLLTSSKNDILHSVLNSNLEEKRAFAFGTKGALTLDKQFTVEVLFKPTTIPQSVFTQSATIFSNIAENTGMVLRQNDTTQNAYIFGFSNRGIILKVTMNTWNYITFIVDNASITGLVNGVVVGTVPTEISYQNSNAPFYIGNQNLNPGYFFGDIREIRISNGKLDNAQITDNWSRIKALH